MTNVRLAISGIVQCLRENVTDPESRAESGIQWIDHEWIDRKLELHYGWPQIAIFEAASDYYNPRKSEAVYFPVIRLEIFASGKEQRDSIADDVKDVLLKTHRVTLSHSGIKIDGLDNESDVLEDERLPMKTYHKIQMYSMTIHDT